MLLFKRNKSRKKVINPYYSLGLMHDDERTRPRVQQLYKRLGQKESFCPRKEFNPHKTITVNQHGHHFGAIIWS